MHMHMLISSIRHYKKYQQNVHNENTISVSAIYDKSTEKIPNETTKLFQH